MPEFTLSPAFTIAGIGAASGIALFDGGIWLVSDKSTQLYRFDTASGKTEKWPLVPGVEFLPKRHKPDFESLCLHEGKLFTFGSGSTPDRNRMAIFNPRTTHCEVSDLSDLYRRMQETAGISAADFNIEGACFAGGWRFFHRGNAPSGRNGMFGIDGNLWRKPEIRFTEIELPLIGNVRSTFTDACCDAGGIWFLASAEDSRSVYEDGAVLGSLIGRMDFWGRISMMKVISETQKFEGISMINSGETPSFMLCEDDDSEQMSTTLYRLAFKKSFASSQPFTKRPHL